MKEVKILYTVHIVTSEWVNNYNSCNSSAGNMSSMCSRTERSAHISDRYWNADMEGSEQLTALIWMKKQNASNQLAVPGLQQWETWWTVRGIKEKWENQMKRITQSFEEEKWNYCKNRWLVYIYRTDDVL